jgi:GMP synthase-like glutamine amidotransferase
MTWTNDRRVAIIDNSIDPDLYRPVDHWNRYLPRPADVFVARKGSLPAPGAHTHVILTGSEASILDRAPWADEEACFVREAFRLGICLLGSCWGHQLLAYALAGPRHVRRCARPEIGWERIRVDRGDRLLGPPGESFVFSVHYDEVVDLPAPFAVLASTEACPVQAFRVGERPIWGIQPHPEVDIPTGRRFLEDLVARGFKGRASLLRALDSEPRDSGLIHRIVSGFLGTSPARSREPVDFT